MCAYIHTGCELSWSHFHFRAFLWSWKSPWIHFIGQRFSTAWWIDTEWDLWFWVCQCGEALWDVHWSKCQTKVITCTVCTCIVYCVFCIALYCVPSLELIQDLHYIKIICFSFFRNWRKINTASLVFFITFRYFLRVSVVRRISDISKELDLAVHTLSSFPEMNNRYIQSLFYFLLFNDLWKSCKMPSPGVACSRNHLIFYLHICHRPDYID